MKTKIEINLTPQKLLCLAAYEVVVTADVSLHTLLLMRKQMMLMRRKYAAYEEKNAAYEEKICCL